jgi:RimJ/RimL family protein N-acetyltransferase/predicted GNAT family acetyltransferase
VPDRDGRHAAKISAVTVERIRSFRRALARGAAERIVETDHGTAYLADSTPEVYDHNYVSVEAPAVSAAALAADAESALADRFHRRVIAEQGTPGLAAEFAGLRYTLSSHLVLAHARAPDRLVDTATISEVTLDDLVAPRTEAILREPWGGDEIAAQLNEAKRHMAGAIPTRFYAAVIDDTVAGWCELRVHGGVAQIEDVEVLAEHRGQGLGRAVVQHALQEAERAADIVFLEALADDWPRELYAKLGFAAVDRRDFYTRLPHPLTRLRLRTRRLELRLATIAEQRRLYAVAEQGIHDPDSMPFGIAWTDALDEGSFLAHHALALESAVPADWTINLVAFHEGQPIGSQAIRAERFPETRTVDTGSWLGRRWQGRGLGTEMRSAVLTFAFDHLGARRATSGAIERNPQSLGVSQKLGYVETGSHLVSPRGTPVEHVDLEVTPQTFTPAVETKVLGLETVLPFLGLAR